MKVAIITDLHFGARDSSLVLLEHFRRFYGEVFFPFLDKNKIERVALLGDTFDRRKFTNHVCLHHAKSILFDELAKRGIQTDVIVGNHDAPYKNTIQVNSPRLFLQEYDNLNIIDRPCEVVYGSTKVAMIPWICPDNFEETMELIKATDAQVAFGHLEIAGFEMYRGSVAEGGYQASLFDKFDMVLSGHYHHKSTRGNINYLGAPYEMTWSDYDDARGWHVFDSEKRTLKFHQNPFHLFQKLVYNDEGKQLDDFMNEDIEHLKGCYVKLLVQRKNNPYWFDLFVSRIEKLGVADLQVQEFDTMTLDTADAGKLENVETTLDIIRRHSAAFVQDKPEQVLTELNKLMTSLYDEALSLGVDSE